MKVILLAGAIVAAALAAAAAADLSGAYRGIAAAQGMRLQFAPEGDVLRGLFVDRTGGSHAFEAASLEAGAETVLDTGRRKRFIRFTPEGAGLQMVSIPFGADDQLNPRNAQVLVFIREGMDLPPRPARYVDPPANPGGVIDPEAFVESYAFWPAKGVSYGYGMVRGRYRTLIRLHAVVQTDILWKMCQAPVAPAGLAEALRGQGVDCGDILERIGEAMRRGAPFNQFKRDVLTQKQALTLAIRCSLDYRRNDPECKHSAARVAAAAVSMETAASVLSRY